MPAGVSRRVVGKVSIRVTCPVNPSHQPGPIRVINPWAGPYPSDCPARGTQSGPIRVAGKTIRIAGRDNPSLRSSVLARSTGPIRAADRRSPSRRSASIRVNCNPGISESPEGRSESSKQARRCRLTTRVHPSRRLAGRSLRLSESPIRAPFCRVASVPPTRGRLGFELRLTGSPPTRAHPSRRR